MVAWAAFQSAKWNGEQADAYARASATRVESTRASTAAGQQTIIDVNTFTAWLDALATERRVDPNGSLAADGSYVPDPQQLSGFLYERFRDEFKSAIVAWLAELPLQNPDAPSTPFVMKQYKLAANEDARRLERQAELDSREARASRTSGPTSTCSSPSCSRRCSSLPASRRRWTPSAPASSCSAPASCSSSARRSSSSRSRRRTRERSEAPDDLLEDDHAEEHDHERQVDHPGPRDDPAHGSQHRLGEGEERAVHRSRPHRRTAAGTTTSRHGRRGSTGRAGAGGE